jgi:membrane protease YdiL (CAAX protease family)
MSLSIDDARRPIIGVILSFILWYIVFLTDILSSFWIRVTLASILLALYAYLIGRKGLPEVKSPNSNEIIKGIISGLLLYGSFKVGYTVFEPFVMRGAENVYTMRSDSPLILAAVFLVVTSFCEEYFWRGYIQTFTVARIGKVLGILLTTTAYAAIHLPTFNIPLILAAFIAGLVWGILFEYTGSLWLVVFSHMVWTELIFVFLPLA